MFVTFGTKLGRSPFGLGFGKVDEIRDCVGVSFEGFEDQFRAFLIVIRAGQPLLARSFFQKGKGTKEIILFYKL